MTKIKTMHNQFINELKDLEERNELSHSAGQNQNLTSCNKTEQLNFNLNNLVNTDENLSLHNI